MSEVTLRTLQRVFESRPTSDGAGVRLRRSLGQTPDARLDPFLMLDEFSSFDASDYIAGFPSHPHRGFETVTYMLDGHMLHEDHLGNRGDLRSGDVQWMTAGRGIVHSEMPQQQSGRMRGFQLWVNLPAREKMKPASYRDIRSQEIPLVTTAAGTVARLVAGRLTDASGREWRGPVEGLTTDPTYIDVTLANGAAFEYSLPTLYNACVYPFEGSIRVGEQVVPTHALGVLTHGDRVVLGAASAPARFLFLAGRPLNEPVAQYGPFVMNTRAELETAFLDYQRGRLTEG